MPIVYVVKKGFDYTDNQHYAPGDVFDPTGARNDANIIKYYCRAESRPDEPKVKKGRPHGANNFVEVS